MPDFNAKMHQNRFRLGLCPRARWGAYSAPPDSLAGFKGPTSKGRRTGGELRGGGTRPVCLLVLTILTTGLGWDVDEGGRGRVGWRPPLCNPIYSTACYDLLSYPTLTPNSKFPFCSRVPLRLSVVPCFIVIGLL